MVQYPTCTLVFPPCHLLYAFKLYYLAYTLLPCMYRSLEAGTRMLYMLLKLDYWVGTSDFDHFLFIKFIKLSQPDISSLGQILN